MGCNCGGKVQASTTRWIYTDPQGRRTVYDKEVQAMAAKVRAGGKGTVVAQPR